MRRALLALLPVLLFAAPAHANFLVEMSYAEKLAASSQVVVARMVRTLPASARPHGRVNEMEVLTTIKGRSVRRLLMFGTSPIAEDELNCCEIGRTYLLFLHRARHIYSPVNGHFAVIPLDRLDDLQAERRR